MLGWKRKTKKTMQSTKQKKKNKKKIVKKGICRQKRKGRKNLITYFKPFVFHYRMTKPIGFQDGAA